MEISNYFDDLSSDLEAMCYASYFAEFAAYYTRENVDETQMLKLLYQSVRALLNKNLPNSLVKVIYEIKAMVLNGEYQENPPCQVSSGARYALEFIITTPVEKLYTFVLTEPVLKEVEKCAEIWKKMFIDRKFQSLEILESIL